MSVEIRRHKKIYIKRWVDGTCRSEYLGHGAEGELKALLHLNDLGLARIERAARLSLSDADREFDSACSYFALMAEAGMIAQGYHRHKNQWRKKKMSNNEPVPEFDSISAEPRNPSANPTAQSQPSMTRVDPPDPDEARLKRELHWQHEERVREAKEWEHLDILKLQDLVRKAGAQYPQKEDIAALRQFLAARPWLWRAAGDPARKAAARLLKHANLPPEEFEIAKASVIDLLNNLYHPLATPLERMLAEQVALRWLQLTVLEYQYAHAMIDGKSPDLRTALFWERRLTQAHARYTRACKALKNATPKNDRRPIQYQFDWTDPAEIYSHDRLDPAAARRYYENSWPNVFDDLDSDSGPASSASAESSDTDDSLTKSG
jgi:hypothetical protein